MEEARIGDFSKPLAGPGSAKAPPQGDTVAKLAATEERLDKEAETVERTLAPLKSYEERLKEAGISKEDAAKIVDDVLMKGAYAEDIPITPRIKLRLRTRLARDTQRIQEFLEIAQPKFDSHYGEIVARYSLAASLESFGQDKFEHPKKSASREEYEKLFQDRLSYVENLPDPVLRLAFNKMFKFDQRVRIALEEGAIENF